MVFIQHAPQAPPEMLGAQGVVLLLLPSQLRLTPPWNGGDLPQATSDVPAGPSVRSCNALHLPLLIAFGVVFASFPGTASTSRPQPHLGDPTHVTQGEGGAGSVQPVCGCWGAPFSPNNPGHRLSLAPLRRALLSAWTCSPSPLHSVL